MKSLLLFLFSFSALAASPTPQVSTHPVNPPPRPPLALPAPITVSKTYDGLWLRNVVIDAPDPKGDVSATMVMKPYVKSTGELAPDEMQIMVQVPDVMTRIMSGDKKAGAIMQLILEYTAAEAKKQGKL